MASFVLILGACAETEDKEIESVESSEKKLKKLQMKIV